MRPPDRSSRKARSARCRPARASSRAATIPYTPAALAKSNDNARNRLTLDPEVKCYMPGIPRANYMPYPFQIVQSPQNILFAYEYASANRVVNMGKPTEAPVDSWMGWSNGKWEGDTLVVDVTGLNGNAWLDRAGNYTTDTTHVVERFTLTDADHINYEATIEDAEALHEALEDQHGALQAHGEELPAARIQVRGVRRRNALRPPAQAVLTELTGSRRGTSNVRT